MTFLAIEPMFVFEELCFVAVSEKTGRGVVHSTG